MHQLRKEEIILHEDDNLLVLTKPSGWVVNDSESTSNRLTLQKFIQENFDFEIAQDFALRSGIVHRLDKETSGVILVAKTPETFEKLQNLFFKREVQKEYLALAHGIFKEQTGKIVAKIGRLPKNRKRFGVVDDGRDAETDYEVVKEFKKDNEWYTLVKLFPKTGRTHQIRVHLKHIGHPVVSDPLYVGRKTLRRDLVWCPRLFLHASKISFINPSDGQPLSVEAPLPPDIVSCIL